QRRRARDGQRAGGAPPRRGPRPARAARGEDGMTHATGPAPIFEEKPRRFRRRVFFYILSLSLLTSVVSGATYYSRQVKFIEKDRARPAPTLLTSLATQAELGAYAGDAALCDLPVRRTAREEDVVLAGIYDPAGKEILRLSQPAVGTPAPAPMHALAPLL